MNSNRLAPTGRTGLKKSVMTFDVQDGFIYCVQEQTIVSE